MDRKLKIASVSGGNKDLSALIEGVNYESVFDFTGGGAFAS